MKRFALLAWMIGLLVVAGCATSQGNPAVDPDVQPLAGDDNPKATNKAQDQPIGGAWEELIRKLRQEYEVSEQQKEAQSNEHYKLAERYYQAGDFDRARLECQKALQLNPNHAAALALMTEVDFILNRGVETSQSAYYRKIMEEAIVRHQQLQVEIQTKLTRGQRLYNLANYDDAEREFRMVLEYAKWMPTGPGIDAARAEAVEWLERTKQSRVQARIDEEKARRIRVEEERMRDEMRRMLEERRELETLFGQAQILFEREEYVDCIRLCDRILYIDPNLGSVQEMKMVASRLRHMKVERDTLKDYIEEWKRTFEVIELASLVQANELEWADRAFWEKVRLRKPKGLQGEMEEEMDPKDKEILGKLDAIRITIDMQNAPLTSVIDYIREISGLNFIIDNANVEAPEDEIITIKVNEIILSGALKLMLNPRNMAHFVEGGVVIVTSKEAIGKRVRLELYDVQDLTYGLQDFPGVDIQLAQDALGAGFGIDEEGGTQQFTGEDLATLIQNTIDPEGWDSDGKSILFQNGLLIVNNTVSAHRNIRKFLSDLRASTGIMVSVETRFLVVEDQWLQQVGMDIRDVDGPRAAGILALDDINPAYVIPGNEQFISPGGGLAATSAGVGYVGGNSIQRNMGARVQNIMVNDFLVNRFFLQSLTPVGGATLQYTLMDDISFEAIVRLVSRSDRAHTLTAPRIVLFNTQRGNIRISNQFAYIRDFDIQIATAAVAPDPVPDVVQDGISLDVRPIVSADRRYVTLELRPTIATLFPPPPNVFGITINLGIVGAPVTTDEVFIETPILNIQRVRTTVVCPDRGTLMLAGLTVFFEMDADSSIPVWRHVPILGNIGSNKFKGRQRKQFLSLLRTKIIIPAEIEAELFD